MHSEATGEAARCHFTTAAGTHSFLRALLAVLVIFRSPNNESAWLPDTTEPPSNLTGLHTRQKLNRNSVTCVKRVSTC